MQCFGAVLCTKTVRTLNTYDAREASSCTHLTVFEANSGVTSRIGCVAPSRHGMHGPHAASADAERDGSNGFDRRISSRISSRFRRVLKIAMGFGLFQKIRRGDGAANSIVWRTLKTICGQTSASRPRDGVVRGLSSLSTGKLHQRKPTAMVHVHAPAGSTVVHASKEYFIPSHRSEWSRSVLCTFFSACVEWL